MIRKISDLINDLQEILKTKGDLQLVYSSDDEGNSFHGIHYGPIVGLFDEEEREFITGEESLAEYGFTEDDFNAVCIN